MRFNLKFFTPLCFLIFFMPFLRMCKGSAYKEAPTRETVQNDAPSTDSQVNNSASDKIENDDVNRSENNDFNLNAYQLSGLQILFSKHKIDLLQIYSDRSLVPVHCYLLIIISSGLMFIFVFFNKLYIVFSLAVLNLILLLISTVLFFESRFIEEFSDVKYGFFIFVIYLLLIIYFCQKELLTFTCRWTNKK